MYMFGMDFPLWAVFIIGIIGAIIAWKLIKFALKILIILVIIFLGLTLIDFLNIITYIQNFITNIT